MAVGRPAASAGPYRGPRTRPRSIARVSVRRSLRSVSGWRNSIVRGSVASIVRQRSRSCGSRSLQPLSASQASNKASSAAWLSVENDVGSTMSGGATPSITVRRTCAGNRRRYSSAARVPYEPPMMLMRSAPRAARTASASCIARVVVKNRRSPYGNAFSRVRQASMRSRWRSRSNNSDSGKAGSSTSHSNGALRPVPRWSISTMSRRLENRPSSPATCGAISIALCPGPPAKKNTGSGRLLRASAGSTA